MEKISVIIPVYNVEDYIEQCIRSVCASTYRNIEIILVDDESTDKSGIICDKYADLDKRIRVIHKKNGGVSEARNIGIENSIGDYISFVDGDDMIDENLYEVLYNNIRLHNADISACRARTSVNSVRIDDICDNSVRVFSKKEDLLKEFFFGRGGNTVPCWSKLYKRKIFLDVRFPVGKIYEDAAIVWELIKRTECMVVQYTRLYFYRIRKGSYVHKNNFNPKLLDQIEVYEQLNSNILKDTLNSDVKKISEARLFFAYRNTIENIMQLDDGKLHMDVVDNICSKLKRSWYQFMMNEYIGYKRKFATIFVMISPSIYMLFKKIKLMSKMEE